MKLARRAFFLAFTVGLLVTIGLVGYTAIEARDISEGETVETELLTLKFFTASRASVDSGGSSFSLSPGFGVVILLIVLPTLSAALAWRQHRSAARSAPVDDPGPVLH